MQVNQEGFTEVYTDGACPNNGKGGARAGVGVWWGAEHPLNYSRRATGDKWAQKRIIPHFILEYLDFQADEQCSRDPGMHRGNTASSGCTENQAGDTHRLPVPHQLCHTVDARLEGEYRGEVESIKIKP